MSRGTEWVLGLAGAAVAAISVLGLAAWLGYGVNRAYAESLWPYNLILTEWTVSGVAGLAGVALDGERRSKLWGLLTWAAIGGLLAVLLFSALSLFVFVVPSLLAFSTAALMADTRRQRNTPLNLILPLFIMAVQVFCLPALGG